MSSLAGRLYRGDVHYDFIGNRKRWYAISGVLLLICLLSIVLRGFNYGIEFRGGTTILIESANIDLDAAEQAVRSAGPSVETRQYVGAGAQRRVLIKAALTTPEQQSEIQTAVAKRFGLDAKKVNVSSVSSSWGREITKKALIALVVFLVAVCVFIALRFEPKMAIGAIVALLHDLVLAAGVYSVVGFEVTPSTVVGLLTILGFSLYDTVVVFDKVTENTRGILGSTRQTYSEAANLAVNQTLMRSINTSLIALLPVAGLLFVGAGLLGVGTLKDLALVLFVGLAAGAYSSIFIATPIVADLKEREPAYVSLRKRVLAKRTGGPAKAKVEPGAEPGEAVAADVTEAGGSEPVPVPAVASTTPRPGARPQPKKSGSGRPQARKKGGGRPQAKRRR
ncbi:MAG TPA: protein translocase subunit SecF [Mycobacteriales bacterium]|nr:protein translocase subunit SecF [Mycobacteriales bacterium]